jgi:hypothetical protein
MALTSLAHYHALTISAVRKWKDPATGKLSKIPPTAKFLVEEKTMYDVGIIKIISDFSVSIVDFLKDIKRPDVSRLAIFSDRLASQLIGFIVIS